MTIQPIGSASVALYITPADLKEHGLTPAGLTLERAALVGGPLVALAGSGGGAGHCAAVGVRPL